MEVFLGFVCFNAFVFFEHLRKFYKKVIFNGCLLQVGFQTDFSLDHLSADYDIVAPKIIQVCGLFNKQYVFKAAQIFINIQYLNITFIPANIFMHYQQEETVPGHMSIYKTLEKLWKFILMVQRVVIWLLIFQSLQKIMPSRKKLLNS